ncbi:putative membrane protein [Bacillus methanolicus PB1]|uniref:Putative membrane protein n=1 Tax=Bacillus methanolicus PB1 TaxID=997296 RepID=I3E0Z9_BACMT|nr:YybS family protein [Bacillus methanolicus]EIJ80170.1 putative membrane protein [Bacillus methanolicus PB1]
MKKNIQRLTEGAVLLAAYSVLLLITMYIPLLGMIVNFFLPLPFILFYAKNDTKTSFVFLIASVVISLVAGSIFAVPLALAYGLTGAVMGYLIREQKNRGTVFIAGSLVFLLNLIIQYIVAVTFFQINFIEEMMKMFRESVDMSLEMLESIGKDPGQKAAEQLLSSVDMIETLMPSLFVVVSFINVFLIQLVSLPILKRFGVRIGKWKAFKDLTLPKNLLWYYLAVLLISMAVNPEEGSYLFSALLNLSFILQLCMIVQGLSFVFYFSSIKGYSAAIPVTVTILSLLLPIILYVVRILGIIDLGFDLRQRLKNNHK